MKSHKFIGLAVLVVCGMMLMSSPGSVQAAPDVQPEMQSALGNLRDAERNLLSATHDKGGHRAKAVQLVRQAIKEVELGVNFDSTHTSPKERH